jgi:ABC-2 type transport system permease protein
VDRPTREESAVRVYLEAMRMSYRRYRAYGAANVAGLLTNAFFGLLRSYVFIALYRARPVAEGYALHDALTYVWLTQALIMPIYMWGWFEIALTIRSGDVVSDLSKPVSYFSFWLSRDLGRAAYHILFRWLPTMAMGLALFRIRLPQDPATWPLFALSLLLAIVLSFCLRFMINVAGFWTTDVRGISGMFLLFVTFLSGFLVPLEFFPPAFRAIALQLPFAGLISIPVNVFLERARGPELLALLAKQALWGAVFILAAQALLRVATRKLVVQGG